MRPNVRVLARTDVLPSLAGAGQGVVCTVLERPSQELLSCEKGRWVIWESIKVAISRLSCWGGGGGGDVIRVDGVDKTMSYVDFRPNTPTLICEKN